MHRYKLDVHNGITGRWLLQKNWDELTDEDAIRIAWTVVQYTGRLWKIPPRYLEWFLYRKNALNDGYMPVTHRIPSDRTKKLGRARYG